MSSPYLRRSKRLKALHQKSVDADGECGDIMPGSTNLNSNVIHGGLDIAGFWMPDEICFHIYSYLSNGSINGNCYANGIAALVHNYSYLSKEFHKSIQRYIPQAALTLRIRYGCRMEKRLEMICSKKVRLRELHVDVGSTNSHIDFQKILKNCDISNLHTVGITLPFYRHSIQNDNMGWLQDSRNFQKFMVDHVAAKSEPKVLKLCSNYRELDRQFLVCFASSLEELEVRIGTDKDDRQVTSDDDCLEVLSFSIEQMTKLRKFKFGQYNQFGAGYFVVRSESLEEMDTLHCDNRFFVRKCICPSLKSFRCLHTPMGSNYEIVNGIDPTELPRDIQRIYWRASARRLLDGYNQPEPTRIFTSPSVRNFTCHSDWKLIMVFDET